MDSNLIWMDLIDMLPVIACGCVLPIVFIWLETRRKINESRDRMQIVTTAIEKHPDMDVEELMKKISPKKKSLKEKLLSKLFWGFITSLIGIGLIVYSFFLTAQEIHSTYDVQTSFAFGVILLAVGAAFIINYGVGRKMLAKEIEAEESKMNIQK